MVQDPAAMVIDHTNYAVSNFDGDHTLIASDDFIKSDVILGSKKIEASIYSDNTVNLSCLNSTQLSMLVLIFLLLHHIASHL